MPTSAGGARGSRLACLGHVFMDGRAELFLLSGRSFDQTPTALSMRTRGKLARSRISPWGKITFADPSGLMDSRLV
jgi:hypothetical protein